jgi:hypothetical protein
MTIEGKKPRSRKEPRWQAPPADERPHERARRGLNRLLFGVDTKKRIASD